jgi:hypothetical protein
MRIRMNDNNEPQMNLRGDVIYSDNEETDDRIEFTLPLLRTDYMFVCPIPYDDERSVQVDVYATPDAEKPTFTVKALVKEKNNRHSLTFLVNVLFWQIVVIVPMPDDPEEDADGKTLPQIVPVYVKPSTLRRNNAHNERSSYISERSESQTEEVSQ